MKFIRLSLYILVALLAIVIAVDNRATVLFSLYPLLDPVEVPLFAVLFLGILAGIVLGGSIAWWSARRHRVAARDHRREAQRLQGEVAQLKTTPPTDTRPAITPPP